MKFSELLPTQISPKRAARIDHHQDLQEGQRKIFFAIYCRFDKHQYYDSILILHLDRPIIISKVSHGS